MNMKTNDTIKNILNLYSKYCKRKCKYFKRKCEMTANFLP